MAKVFHIKTMDLQDIVDKLADENYVRVTKEEFRTMKPATILKRVAMGYQVLDLSGLLPHTEDYIYFIPYTIYKDYE